MNYIKSLMFSALCVLSNIVIAQTPTVGLIEFSDDAYNGYTLFGGGPSNGGGFGSGNGSAFLIDNCGELIHSWNSQYNAGLSQYVDYQGNLVRPIVYGGNNSVGGNGGAGGGVAKLDWQGNQLWVYNVNANGQYMQHHDIEPLPNGNLLVIAWEARTAAEAAARGRVGGGSLTPEWIFEVEQDGATGGNIVWEWRVFDHTVQDVDASLDNYGIIANHPELFDINNGNTGDDWLHYNGIDYNEEFDLIVISARFINELFVIDHSTTTEEAASHEGGNYGKGGDFLYRWGNPANYNQGTTADRTLLGQHGARWVLDNPTGNPMISVFNNNNSGGGGGSGSRAVAFELPMNEDGSFNYTPGQAYEPAQPIIDRSVPSANTGSSVQGLPNGNFLYCTNAGGDIGEFNFDGDLLWNYIIPTDGGGPVNQGQQGGSSSFIAERYETDFIGFAGQDLTPQGPIELNPYDSECEIVVTMLEAPVAGFTSVTAQDSLVTFTDSSTGTIDTWLWNFGNGETSTEQNPNYTFTESGDYDVCLTVSNTAGENMSCQTITISIPVGLNDVIFSDIKLYPQPANDIIYIETAEHNFVEATITDLAGKTVLQQTFNRAINISELQAGIYLIYLTNENDETYSQKLLVD